MKRILGLLLVFAVAGSASAQKGEFIGGSLAFFLGPVSDYFTNGDDVGLFLPDSLSSELHVGDYGLFGPFGFREIIGVDLLYFDQLKLGGDVLVPVFERPFVYLGGGAGVTMTSYDGVFVDVRGVVGTELGLTSHLALFGELNPGYHFVSGRDSGAGLPDGSAFGVQVRVGLNVYP